MKIDEKRPDLAIAGFGLFFFRPNFAILKPMESDSVHLGTLSYYTPK